MYISRRTACCNIKVSLKKKSLVVETYAFPYYRIA